MFWILTIMMSLNVVAIQSLGTQETDLSQEIRIAEQSVNQVHSRRKRYVVFPEGSTFTVAFCMSLKAITGPDLIFTEGVNWALSYDLPNETIHDRDKMRPFLIKRHKRDLYYKMEKLISSAGIDGKSCVLKTLCETAQQILPRQGVVEELVRLIFSYPVGINSKSDGVYTSAHSDGLSNINCNDAYPCPISVLDLALGFGSYHPDSPF